MSTARDDYNDHNANPDCVGDAQGNNEASGEANYKAEDDIDAEDNGDDKKQVEDENEKDDDDEGEEKGDTTLVEVVSPSLSEKRMQ